VANDRNLDDIDLQILELLQANARETQVEIAKAVGLAPSAVQERIRKLEARGTLRGYTAQIDPRALDLGLLAFVAVRSDALGSESRIAQALGELPEVLEVHHVAGDDCYLIKVRARDAEHLGQLLRTRFSRVAGVRSTRTTIVLETSKETSRLPIARSSSKESVVRA
jgi:Lrp/AsnC family leucine-responsive transcriptional regulator